MTRPGTSAGRPLARDPGPPTAALPTSAALMWWDGGERAITAREKSRIEEHSPSCFTIPLAPPVDVDNLLADCVPGGSITDPQVVADNIRAWFAKPADLAEQQGVDCGYVIADGTGEKFMAWGQVGPEWVADRSAALWLVRRADAEALAAENEDAWLILPVQRCALPPAGWSCTLMAGHAGPCPTLAATGKQQVGEVQWSALASLPLYRLADDANGNRGLHRDDTGSWVKLQDVERALAARQPGTKEPVDNDWHLRGYAYASKQATTCAGCGKHKHTPLRIDAMGGYVCLTCIDQRMGALLGEFGYPPARGIDLEPRPMNTAPRDGTMIRLLVQFREHATEDKPGPAWTIGACNDYNVGELEWGGWQFAGWCWTHDHFTEGKGMPVGWLPLIDGQCDAAPGVDRG